MKEKKISTDARDRKIFFRLADKNKTLIRRNHQLKKWIRNTSYILGTDTFLFQGTEPNGKSGR